MKRMAAVKFRASREEIEQLREAAHRARLALGTLVRNAALGQVIQPPPAVPEVNRKLYSDLAHVGSNLNQIARHLNAGDFHMIGGDQLAAAILDLQEIVGEVRGHLLGRPEAGE